MSIKNTTDALTKMYKDAGLDVDVVAQSNAFAIFGSHKPSVDAAMRSSLATLSKVTRSFGPVESTLDDGEWMSRVSVVW